MVEQDFFTLAHRGRVQWLAGELCKPLSLQSTLAAASGVCAGRRFLAVATDPTVTRGAIGVDEALELRRLIERARRDDLPLVLIIDSAGARVSEGVAVQGALRHLFADMLAARAAGLRTLAILGRNVFGGASMLAMLCDTRLYARCTRLAMTGPAAIQSHNSVSAQTVTKTIAAANRLERDRRGVPIGNGEIAATLRLREMLPHVLDRQPPSYQTWLHTLGADLRARLVNDRARATSGAVEVVQPCTVKLRGLHSAGPADVMALVDALHTLRTSCSRIVLECDWAGHSMRLAGEDCLLSQYLAYLCGVIHATEARGTRVQLRIAGELSGGLYIALAGAASEVRLAVGARVLTLPQYVLDAFIKLPSTPEPDADTLIQHGVIDTIAH